MRICLTLNSIKIHRPEVELYTSEWEKLLKTKAGTNDFDLFPLSDVVKVTNVGFAIWCTRALPEHNKLWRQFAIWCVKQTQIATTELGMRTIELAERWFVNGERFNYQDTTENWNNVENTLLDTLFRESTSESILFAAIESASDVAYHSGKRQDWEVEYRAARKQQEAEFLRLIG